MPESIATWTKSRPPAASPTAPVTISPTQPLDVPSNASTTEVDEELDDEGLDGLFAGLSPLHSEIFHDWTLEAFAGGSPSAASVATPFWNIVSDSHHPSDDGGELIALEEPRLWLSDQNHLSSVAVNVALDTSEALAFTFCESLMLQSPLISLEKGSPKFQGANIHDRCRTDFSHTSCSRWTRKSIPATDRNRYSCPSLASHHHRCRDCVHAQSWKAGLFGIDCY